MEVLFPWGMFRLQLERFREFLKLLPLDQVKLYIDLRISNKIVYQ